MKDWKIKYFPLQSVQWKTDYRDNFNSLVSVYYDYPENSLTFFTGSTKLILEDEMLHDHFHRDRIKAKSFAHKFIKRLEGLLYFEE